jgi:hypothetical protein
MQALPLGIMAGIMVRIITHHMPMPDICLGITTTIIMALAFIFQQDLGMAISGTVDMAILDTVILGMAISATVPVSA